MRGGGRVVESGSCPEAPFAVDRNNIKLSSVYLLLHSF